MFFFLMTIYIIGVGDFNSFFFQLKKMILFDKVNVEFKFLLLIDTTYHYLYLLKELLILSNL